MYAFSITSITSKLNNLSTSETELTTEPGLREVSECLRQLGIVSVTDLF